MAAGMLLAGAERYDPVRGEFTRLSGLEFTPRAGHTATLLTDGHVLFAGGETRGGVRAELWDPAANTVAVVPRPPRYERTNAGARLLADGRVEIAGGTDAAGAPVPAAEIFDPDLSSFVSARSRADWLGPSA